MSRKHFYIGWKDKMPQRNQKYIRLYLVGLLICVPILIGILVYNQKPFNDYQFKMYEILEFEGIYHSNPYPILEITSNNIPYGYSNFALLVGLAKYGARGIMENIESNVGKLDGKAIKIRGSLIFGDGKILIQLTEKEKAFLSILSDSAKQEKQTYGHKTKLFGEIIDPKCWFGAMKPGSGKVHKSCAIRCISGGIPPVFKVAKQGNGNYDYYILSNAQDSHFINHILPFVAEDIEITGQSYFLNGWKVLSPHKPYFYHK